MSWRRSREGGKLGEDCKEIGGSDEKFGAKLYDFALFDGFGRMGGFVAKGCPAVAQRRKPPKEKSDGVLGDVGRTEIVFETFPKKSLPCGNLGVEYLAFGGFGCGSMPTFGQKIRKTSQGDAVVFGTKGTASQRGKIALRVQAQFLGGEMGQVIDEFSVGDFLGSAGPLQ